MLPPHGYVRVVTSGRSALWPLGRSGGYQALSANTRVRHVRRAQCLSPVMQAQQRGARTQAAVVLDYGSGTEPALQDLLTDRSSKDYPTVVKQARIHMTKFENCVLLTRVGGFYELYFEHAELYATQLHLKLGRKQTLRGTVPMAGFPFFQLDRYLKILVQDLNQSVAIAEEFPNDVEARVKAGGLLHDRRVARVVTPGTLIDEKFMDPNLNNYILSIELPDNLCSEANTMLSTNLTLSADPAPPPAQSIGLAWLDLSTGQFLTQSVTMNLLPTVISRISPREVVLHESARNFKESDSFPKIMAESRQTIAYSPRPVGTLNDIDWLDSQFGPRSTKDYQGGFLHEEVQAASLLMHYVETRLQCTGVKLQAPRRYFAQHTMVIDGSTMRALEIKITSKEGSRKGTLLHAVRRTKTSSGTRLLDDWLSAPSTDVNVINGRLDLVSYMLEHRKTSEQIVAFLKNSHDSARLVQKFALGRGDADDLVALADTILIEHQLESILTRDFANSTEAGNARAQCLASTLDRLELDVPLALAHHIKSSVDEEAVVQQHQNEDNEAGVSMELATKVAIAEGTAADLASVTRKSVKKKPTSLKEHYANEGNIWIMKPAASAVLTELHRQLQEYIDKEEELTKNLQERLNVSALTLRWTPGLGHICHVKIKPREKMDTSEVRSVSSSKSTHSFHHPEWTALGKEIDQLKLRIRAEERQVFLRLRAEVVRNLVKLRNNASVLDELDIACSSASLAAEQNLVRPLLNNSTTHKIINGRHPTVQNSLSSSGRTFTSNSLFLTPQKPLWLLTGPNMAGKSTFLRQNALITILAQTGLFVPAEYAEIGIVDQMFSRIGSADNLSNNESTFMVEMLETAAILKQATPKSFVIMDEIGRGTTPEDGEAVAFACLNHLYNRNRCRTIFATHFHGLPGLCEREQLGGVGFYCTDVLELEGGGFSYDHRLRQGVNRKSHALKVAAIAGVPLETIETARRILETGKGKAENTRDKEAVLGQL